MAITKKIVLVFVAVIVLLAGIFWLGRQDIAQVELTSQTCSLIAVDDNTFCLWVADSGDERGQGLSGIYRETMGVDGMIFVFEDSAVRNFWMLEMRFDLDVLWVKDGVIVKIDKRIRAPETSGEEPQGMSSDPYEVDQVIELPAGSVNTFALNVGDQVRLSQ